MNFNETLHKETMCTYAYRKEIQFGSFQGQIIYSENWNGEWTINYEFYCSMSCKNSETCTENKLLLPQKVWKVFGNHPVYKRPPNFLTIGVSSVMYGYHTLFFL